MKYDCKYDMNRTSLLIFFIRMEKFVFLFVLFAHAFRLDLASSLTFVQRE